MKECSFWNVSNNTYGRANYKAGGIYLRVLVFNRGVNEK